MSVGQTGFRTRRTSTKLPSKTGSTALSSLHSIIWIPHSSQRMLFFACRIQYFCYSRFPPGTDDCRFSLHCLPKRHRKLDNSLVDSAVPPAIAQWGPGKLDACWNTLNAFFANSHALTPAEISRIKAPLKIVRCDNDIAYSYEDALRLKDIFAGAGVRAELEVIPGAPQYGCVTHGTR